MPACGPGRGSPSGLVRPIFISKHSRPSRGGRNKTSSGAASLGWLAGGREIKKRGTSRGSDDVSHGDQDQVGASTHSVLVSSLVLKGQAQARSPEASGKGFHIGAMRPRPTERHDRGHRAAQDGVITSAFGRRRPPLVRITCTSCLPLNLVVVGSLPAHIWGEDQGLYK